MRIDSSPSTHAVGVALVVLSAVVFSGAGLFTRAVAASAWDIIFWRGLFATLFTFGYVLCRGRLRREFLEMRGSGMAAALAGAGATAAFIPAFRLTTIANVSLIYAACPLFAALIAWAWAGERMTGRVAAGCAASLAGVGVIVGGSLGRTHLSGDLLALAMTALFALMLAIYRRYPATPAAGPAVVSALVLLPPAWVLGTPLANTAGDIAVMSAFGLAFAVAAVALGEGVRRLPAGEAGLLSSLEILFAPLLAWLLLAELPPSTTAIGGVMVLAGVLAPQLQVLQSRARHGKPV